MSSDQHNLFGPTELHYGNLVWYTKAFHCWPIRLQTAVKIHFHLALSGKLFIWYYATCFRIKLFYQSAKFFARQKINCSTINQKQKVFILELSLNDSKVFRIKFHRSIKPGKTTLRIVFIRACCTQYSITEQTTLARKQNTFDWKHIFTKSAITFPDWRNDVFFWESVQTDI